MLYESPPSHHHTDTFSVEHKENIKTQVSAETTGDLFHFNKTHAESSEMENDRDCPYGSLAECEVQPAKGYESGAGLPSMTSKAEDFQSGAEDLSSTMFLEAADFQSGTEDIFTTEAAWYQDLPSKPLKYKRKKFKSAFMPSMTPLRFALDKRVNLAEVEKNSYSSPLVSHTTEAQDSSTYPERSEKIEGEDELETNQRLELDEQELARLRFDSQRKLANTFERIFEKYSSDFEGVSDIIDLSTGEIIEDHGFVRRLSVAVQFGCRRARRKRRQRVIEVLEDVVEEDEDESSFTDSEEEKEEEDAVSAEEDVGTDELSKLKTPVKKLNYPEHYGSGKKRKEIFENQITDEEYSSGSDDNELEPSEEDVVSILKRRKQELALLRAKIVEEDRKTMLMNEEKHEPKMEQVIQTIDDALLSGPEDGHVHPPCPSSHEENAHVDSKKLASQKDGDNYLNETLTLPNTTDANTVVHLSDLDVTVETDDEDHSSVWEDQDEDIQPTAAVPFIAVPTFTPCTNSADVFAVSKSMGIHSSKMLPLGTTKPGDIRKLLQRQQEESHDHLSPLNLTSKKEHKRKHEDISSGLPFFFEYDETEAAPVSEPNEKRKKLQEQLRLGPR